MASAIANSLRLQRSHTAKCACAECSSVRPRAQMAAAAPAPRANFGLRCSPTTSSVAPRLSATRQATVAKASTAKAVPAIGAGAQEGAEAKYLAARAAVVQQSFPEAMPVDDFLMRVELALCAHGFNGDNSIAICNLCRDEATNVVKRKLEDAYPLVFNINGLGGNITCGIVGMGAGLSHSPTSPTTGKKQYIFFSMPHISIDSYGKAGAMARPGQQACNAACGAMIGALGQMSAPGGMDEYLGMKAGDHHDADPEFSILKQRLAQRIKEEGQKIEDIDLVEMTKIGERQITADLEFLISQAVDTKTADYAIITGTQIHNYGQVYDNEEPNLEFIAPTQVAVVINGKRTELDVKSMPALSPRIIRAMSADNDVVAYTGSSTVSALKNTTSAAVSVEEKKASREAKFTELLKKSS